MRQAVGTRTYCAALERASTHFGVENVELGEFGFISHLEQQLIRLSMEQWLLHVALCQNPVLGPMHSLGYAVHLEQRLLHDDFVL